MWELLSVLEWLGQGFLVLITVILLLLLIRLRG